MQPAELGDGVLMRASLVVNLRVELADPGVGRLVSRAQRARVAPRGRELVVDVGQRALCVV